MIEKQFGTQYGPSLQHGEKAACMVNLQAEIDRRGGVPYGWMRVYEALLFGFYNPRSGECFPSHQAVAVKARCSISTVQRALKWARESHLIAWTHGAELTGVGRCSVCWRTSGFASGRAMAKASRTPSGQ